MKLKRMVLAALLALAFSFSSIQADTTTIKDIDKSSGFAKDAILALAEQNIISGDAKGNFNPSKTISRAEIVVLLVRTLELDTTNVPKTATFKDVPKNHWAFKYVEAAYREGIISGISAKEFGINNSTNREQIAVMFVRALKLIDESDAIEIKNINGLKDKNSIAAWAQKEVDVALASGLMNGVGSNTFGPKGNATKEQAAVVLNRFMKDKNTIVEKVNNAYNINKELKLIFNGDVVSSKYYIMDESNGIFVSKEFVDKFIIIEEDAASQYKENKELYIEETPIYGPEGNYSLWFKVGSLNAYKNLGSNPNHNSGTPYANEEKLVDSLITLEKAPIEKDGTIYVPLKELVQIFNIKSTVETGKNRITLENSFAPKYPNLNSAVKVAAREKYVGNLDMLMEVSMKDLATGEYMKTYAKNKTILGKEAMSMQNTVKLEIDGETETLESREIITKDKVYSLDIDNKWVEYDRKEWEGELGQIPTEQNEGRLPIGFVSAYNNLPIQKAGTTKVNGSSADKYTIKVGMSELQYFMAKDQYEQIKTMMDATFGGAQKYDVELYVADGQIVRQVVKFSGKASEGSTEVLEFSMTIDANYSNIGVDSKIELPQASQIKQPE